MYVLEIAVFTLDGALRAVEGGANRLELCENPNDGGHHTFIWYAEKNQRCNDDSSVPNYTS